MKLGATGRYPQGKLNKDDEGELSMAVAFNPKTGCVHIEFGTQVVWLGLPPHVAKEFGEAIIRAAGQAPKTQ